METVVFNVMERNGIDPKRKKEFMNYCAERFRRIKRAYAEEQGDLLEQRRKASKRDSRKARVP
jgi:hypothetical protein